MADTKRDPRAKELATRSQSLEPRLSHLSVDATSARVAGLVVKRDGVDLPEALWGSKIPIDGGKHTLDVSAPGKKPYSTTVSVKQEKDDVNVVLPKLEDLSSSAPVPSTSAPAATPTAPTAPPPANPTAERAVGGMSTLRTAGLVTGIVGVVGLGVGGYFTATALSKNSSSKADNHCDASNFCDSTGKSLRNDAKSAAGLATAFVIGGGVLVAGGATLFLVGGPNPSKQGQVHVQLAPQMAREGGGLHLSGTW